MRHELQSVTEGDGLWVTFETDSDRSLWVGKEIVLSGFGRTVTGRVLDYSVRPKTDAPDSWLVVAARLSGSIT